MLEDIFHQTADADTVDQFVRLVRDKKREGKKDNKGCYYFIPPATSSHFTPHKPKPAPYASLVQLDLLKLSPDADGHVSKKLKTDRHDNPLRPDGSGATPPPTTAAPPAAPTSPRRRCAGGRAPAPRTARRRSRRPSRCRRQRTSMCSSSSSSSRRSSSRSRSPSPQASGADDDDDVFGAPAPARPGAAAAEGTRRAAAAAQPIATRRRPVAAKKNGVASPTPNTISPPSKAQDAAAAPVPLSMPAAVDDIFPSAAPARKGSLVQLHINFPSKVGVLDRNDRKSRLRTEARRLTTDGAAISDSFVRGLAAPDGDSEGEGSPAPASAQHQQQPLQQQRPARAAALRSTRSARKRSHDEADEDVSPTTVSFPPAGAARLGPQLQGRHPRPASQWKARTGLRVKNS